MDNLISHDIPISRYPNLTTAWGLLTILTWIIVFQSFAIKSHELAGSLCSALPFPARMASGDVVHWWIDKFEYFVKILSPWSNKASLCVLKLKTLSELSWKLRFCETINELGCEHFCCINSNLASLKSQLSLVVGVGMLWCVCCCIIVL